MRRLAIVALLALIGVVLALRRGGDARRAEPRDAPAAAEETGGVPTERPAAAAFVSGVVSGRYGPMAGVPITARADGEVLAETVTDKLGRYRLELPAGSEVDIDAMPVPETELAPARRTVLPVAGEEIQVDFELARGGTASGTVTGARGNTLDIVAIRADDYPPGPDPPPIGALEAAPKMDAVVTCAFFDEAGPHRFDPAADFATSFAFRGLDPEALYRLAVLDRGWAIDGVVLFRAGETNVSARVIRVLRVFVEAVDIETGKPIANFRVSLVAENGTVLETLHGTDGRLSCSFVGDRGNPQTFVVAADGYVDASCPAHGVRRVALSRAREPNVLLRIGYEDGTPYDGEVKVRFESIEDPDGLIDATVQKAAPGRFRTTVPAGVWRLHVSRPRAFHGVTQIADVELPEDGTTEATLRFRRGGTVTFEGAPRFISSLTIEREEEGEWRQLFAPEGTWEDVPCGTYRVMDGDKEHARFEVTVGASVTVRGPPRETDRLMRDSEELFRELERLRKLKEKK